MVPDSRLQAVQMCSLVAQVEPFDLAVLGTPLRLATSLMFLAADGVDRDRLLEALEHLHYI